ncbi:MAG: 50S ribosomal protein L5 [Nitrospinota bacterium]|jgi:large subunit ribosomal protein L5|nr:MAG: 50S ribosomal protein L5 [Nitrospinae bacterium RIFCSPHIGHO2_02_39_11]OGV99938.1 MAG: 50S ribosomal protein L5 [Nitrospinae bacterium RIFCSPHIGHO2_12_FULL_39_42]OGW02132.1 MAG: 50S ribosomal protein L5 [Nitrospinae bacterium RIFCSPHIGHO2_02_FULL_39_82]OGW02321.1 MAG: 50S ribosomal protein L5 [Nitrospinae bacterium RIFCSPLOWO2_02_39_17]OGW04679.1 MAG: 50S ribosomal protein L5 [Nitrospinae bacterium RIFCSPLOWO2_02_FULL_39_110]OGW09912.1 MAG: 50S ribosomal protein L5 [Nitrospinae bacteriu
MAQPSLKEKYLKDIVSKLKKELGYKNVMQVPKVKKIVINMGLGEALQNAKLIDSGIYTLSQISGQKPIVTRAKKAISNFKLRAGVPIGCTVTMRGNHMYEFLDRFINIAMPRIRDFKGVSSKSFDGRGSCTIGIKEQLIFPEIQYDKIEKIKGLNVTIVTTAKTDEEGKSLLRLFGMPFRN